MTTRGSRRLLRDMLRSAGVNLDAPRAQDVQLTFDVWRTFAMVPMEDLGPRAIETDADGLLFQYGMHGGPHGAFRETFVLDFTRQYIHERPHGEDTAQLSCTFLIEPTPALEALASWNVWSFGLDREEFRRRVERSAGFRAVVDAGLQPVELIVEMDQVC